MYKKYNILQVKPIGGFYEEKKVISEAYPNGYLCITFMFNNNA